MQYRAMPVPLLRDLIALAEAGSRSRAYEGARLSHEVVRHDIETLVAARRHLAGKVEEHDDENTHI